MAHLIRTVAWRAGLVRSAFPALARSVFSDAGIGLDNFKVSREQHLSRHAPSLDSFKKAFLESIKKPDSQIFTEDLRNMIMSASNDEEIQGVIQAVKKYNANKQKFGDYHFGPPILRLLYVHNKADLAMELFMDESLKDIFRDNGSVLILMNKLVDDKRYDDALKVFEFASQRGFSSSGRAYPTDIVMLAIEALYRQNTKEALAKAKQLLFKVTEHDSEINPRTASMAALLAIQQNEASFAMEILGAIRTQNVATIQNLRAICYAQMDRIEEAINIVHLLADQPPMYDDRRRIFPLVLQEIQKAVDKSQDPNVRSRFEDLSKFVTKNDRLSSTDILDFLNEPINRRGGMVPNREGNQQNSSGGYQRSFQRDGNARGGYNQQSNSFRQRPRSYGSGAA